MVDLPGAHASCALVVTVLETNTLGVEQEIMRKYDGSECIVIWYAILIWLMRKLSSSPGSVEVDCYATIQVRICQIRSLSSLSPRTLTSSHGYRLVVTVSLSTIGRFHRTSNVLPS